MILVLGGTSTTHEVMEVLHEDYIISVATEYGFAEFSKRYPDRVVHVRFTFHSLMEFIKARNIKKIIDATHPHANEITETAKRAAAETGILYIDRVRSVSSFISYEQMHTFTDYEKLVDFIGERGYQRIIITTGSNNIDKFTDFAERAYVRVLPFEKSVRACTDSGFHHSKIIAMQGPFSKEFNKALIRELKADCMVTKNSGEGSGFAEKVYACSECGIDVLVIEPPK